MATSFAYNLSSKLLPRSLCCDFQNLKSCGFLISNDVIIVQTDPRAVSPAVCVSMVTKDRLRNRNCVEGQKHFRVSFAKYRSFPGIEDTFCFIGQQIDEKSSVLLFLILELFSNLLKKRSRKSFVVLGIGA